MPSAANFIGIATRHGTSRRCQRTQRGCDWSGRNSLNTALISSSAENSSRTRSSDLARVCVCFAQLARLATILTSCKERRGEQDHVEYLFDYEPTSSQMFTFRVLRGRVREETPPWVNSHLPTHGRRHPGPRSWTPRGGQKQGNYQRQSR